MVFGLIVGTDLSYSYNRLQPEPGVNEDMDGEPLQLVAQDPSDRRFHLVGDTVERVFSQLEATLVAILSIAGALREGKSFFLNYVLRYLDTNDVNNNDTEPLGPRTAPLLGFVSRGDEEPETKGIWIWSKPFMRTLPDGRQVAVLLIDTQGTCEGKGNNDGLIFALSGLVSNLQLFNVIGNPNATVLDKLSVLIRHSFECMPEEGVKKGVKMESLFILLRDWQLNDCYGFEGGTKSLEKIYERSDDETRKLLDAFHQPLECYRMSHPKGRVGQVGFTGSLSELDPLFVQQLEEVIPSLVRKLLESEGIGATGEDMAKYFKACFDALNEKEPIMTLIEAHVRTKLANVCHQIVDFSAAEFKTNIEQIISTEKVTSVSILQGMDREREVCLSQAKANLNKRRALSGSYFDQFENQLAKDLGKTFDRLEADVISVTCYIKIKRLKNEYKKQLDSFVNRNYISFMYTSQEDVNKHNEQIIDAMRVEFDRHHELKGAIDDINLRTEMDATLADQSKKRTNAVVTSGVLVVTSLFSLALGGVILGGKAASKAGTYAAEATPKLTSKVTTVISSLAYPMLSGAGTALTGMFRKPVAGPGATTAGNIQSDAQVNKLTAAAEALTALGSIFRKRKAPEDAEKEFNDLLKDLTILMVRYASVGGNLKNVMAQLKY